MAKNLEQVFSNYFSHLRKIPKKGKSNHKWQDLPQKELPHELSIILFHPENRLYMNKFLIKGLNRLSMRTFHVEHVPIK